MLDVNANLNFISDALKKEKSQKEKVMAKEPTIKMKVHYLLNLIQVKCYCVCLTKIKFP